MLKTENEVPVATVCCIVDSSLWLILASLGFFSFPSGGFLRLERLPTSMFKKLPRSTNYKLPWAVN